MLFIRLAPEGPTRLARWWSHCAVGTPTRRT